MATFVLWGCQEELSYDIPEENAPVITGFTPQEGRLGDLINIEGEYLQDVDSVTIGGGMATIKYRINSTSMVVVVNSDAHTGPIAVSNAYGVSQSDNNFTVNYPVPVIGSFPSKAKAYSSMVIEGENLDVVTNVSFDTTNAVITIQQPSLLEVEVPFFRNLNVDLVLTYPTADGQGTVETTGDQFELELDPPTITFCPDEAERNTEITIVGKDLFMVDEVLFGDKVGTIVSQGDTTLTVIVPEFSVTSTVEINLHFFGDVVVAQPEFTVQVATLAFWENQTINNAVKGGGAFFDAVAGTTYTACEFEDKKESVHFFLSIEDGKFKIVAQDADGSHIKNYACDGNPLAEAETPNTVRVRKLNSSYGPDNDLMNKVKNQTLEELNNRVLQELQVGNATYKDISYGAGSSSKFEEGDVLIFQQYNADLTAVEFTGAFEITKVDLGDNNLDENTEASITFNCFFGAF